VKRAFLLIPVLLAAQQKAPPPKLEPPQPVLAWIYPAGGQRGHTVEVTLAGTGIAADSILVSGTGVVGKPIDAKPDGTQARISLTIAPDAEPGVRELRILNDGGVSNRFRFAVGDLPEISETEPNSDRAHAQPISAIPIVINGQILESDRDYFRFHARAGETIACRVEARSLLPYIADAVPGWFDPVLAIYDSAGRQLQYADDDSFRPDPVLAFQAPADGEYTLEVRDVIYRGRGDFVYRLTIGAHAAPSAFQPPPTDLAITPESEPNNTPAQAQRIAIPAAIDGVIQSPGDSDYYVFTARAGDKLVMEIQARRYGSPLDSILTLYNGHHDQLAENDDWTDPLSGLITHQADSRLVYTFTAAGDCYLRVRDIQVKGGDDYRYRLIIGPPRPDFTLRITPDNPRLGQGDTAAIAVSAVRRDDFNGDIRLSVAGLPEGFTTSEASIPAGQNEGRLTISAPPSAALGVISPDILGTAIIGKDTALRRAQPAEAAMQAFAYTHYLPTRQLLLAVIPPSAFTLRMGIPLGQPIRVKPGTETAIALQIRRTEGARNPVTILPLRLLNGAITTKSVQVTPDQDQATITLTISPDAKPGRQNLIVSAVMRAGGQTVTRYARAVTVEVTNPEASGH